MSESRIVSDPAVLMGKPVLAGTRITVELLLEKLGSGESSKGVVWLAPRPSCHSTAFKPAEARVPGLLVVDGQGGI